MSLQSWVLVALSVMAILLVIFVLWQRARKESEEHRETVMHFVRDTRRMELEQYVRDLERWINDVSFKLKEIDDPDQRKSWKSYEQKLRNRQLTVIQEIQDKEWRKVRKTSLTQQEMLAVEETALREIRRMEKETWPIL